MNLRTTSFALAGGVIWGGAMFAFTLIAASTGYAAEFLSLFSSLYPGYDISFPGSIIGLIYGFIDAWIGCLLFAMLYNRLVRT